MSNINKELETIIKLNSITEEYLRLEKEKRDYAKKMVEDDHLDNTAVETIYLMQNRLNHLTKQIITLVDRCSDRDYNMDNECATVIYNYYKPLLRRGLFQFD